MTGQPPLAVIHTLHGTTGLEAPNHQSHSHMQLLVALPCCVLETKELGDGCQLFSPVAFWVAILYKANCEQESRMA